MDSEENKMKTSDTPRSDAAEYLQYDTEPPLPLGLVDVEFARKLEIELNTAIANEAFAENKAYMLEKKLKQAQDRIKERDEWNEKLDEIIDRKTEKIILLNEIRHEAGVQDAYLREKLSAANERIKRLESDAISAKWMWMMNYCKAHGFSPTLGWESAEKAWTAAFEAKEAKP